MGNNQEPLQALGPVDWDDLPHEDMKGYLDRIFSQALVVADSIPSPEQLGDPVKSSPSGRSRAKTESAAAFADVHRSLSPLESSATIAAAGDLRKDWKEVKMNTKENPLDVNVYKMPGKDGRGAWFARQSIHDTLTFDEWKTGLEREFAESLKVQGAPGVGSIRGIGADKRVENKEIEDSGKLSGTFYALSFYARKHPQTELTHTFCSISAISAISWTDIPTRFCHPSTYLRLFWPGLKASPTFAPVRHCVQAMLTFRMPAAPRHYSRTV